MKDTKNLLVNWLNKNQSGNVQTNLNKNSATNIKDTGLKTPNPATSDLKGWTKSKLQQQGIIQPTIQANNNSKIQAQMDKWKQLNNQQNVNYVANQNNQSRFIGMQNPYKPNTDLAGNVTAEYTQRQEAQKKAEQERENNKPVLNIPTQSKKISDFNTQQEKKYRNNEQAIKDFHYDVQKYGGMMSKEQISELYPEFKGKEDIALMLQADILPLVQNNEFADMKKLSELYPELLPEKKSVDAKKYSEKANKVSNNITSLGARAEKLLSGKNTLSSKGRDYLENVYQVSEVIKSIKRQYDLPGNPTDYDILVYAKDNIPGVSDLINNTKWDDLTEMDKAAINRSSASFKKNVIATLQEGMNDVSNSFQRNIVEPMNTKIESGEWGRRLSNLGINPGSAEQGLELAQVPVNMAGNLLEGVNKVSTAGTRIAQGQDRNLNELTKDVINLGGGAMNVGFNTVMAIPTAIFEAANTTDMGEAVTENTLGLFTTGIDNILSGKFAEDLGLSKDTYLASWYNSLDEETKSDLVNELTLATLHKGGKVLKEGKLELETAVDAVSNAFERGKGGALFQAWVEKGMADEGGKMTKGARGRILKEGYNEFKDALKENFRMYNTVLKNRRGDITANMNTLPDNRTFRDKAGEKAYNAGVKTREVYDNIESGINKVKEGANNVVQGVKNVNVGNAVKGTAEMVGKGVKATSDLYNKGKNAVTQGKNAVTNAVKENVVEPFKKGYEGVKETVNENIVEPYNKGRGTNEFNKKSFNQGQQLQESNSTSEINNKVNGDNYTQKNTNSKKLNKVQLKLLQNNNRMNPKAIDTFKEWYGEDYGQYMYDRGFTKSADGGNLKEMENYKDSLLSQKRETLNKIEGTYQDISLQDMAEHLVEKAENVRNRKLLKEAQGLLNKHNETGLTMPEADRLRTLFTQNVKMGFHQDIPADARERAKNEYMAVKDFLDDVGRKNGFDDLDYINREIQKTQHIIKGIESKLNRESANNAYTLTDYILMAEAFTNPQTAAVFTAKQVLKNPKVRSAGLNVAVGGRGNAKNRVTAGSREKTNENVESIAGAKRKQKEMGLSENPALPESIKLRNVVEIDKRKPTDTTPPTENTPTEKVEKTAPKKKSESKPKNKVTSKKSEVTEKKTEPKAEKKETPKAEKQLETRVENKKPEPKGQAVNPDNIITYGSDYVLDNMYGQKSLTNKNGKTVKSVQLKYGIKKDNLDISKLTRPPEGVDFMHYEMYDGTHIILDKNGNVYELVSGFDDVDSFFNGIVKKGESGLDADVIERLEGHNQYMKSQGWTLKDTYDQLLKSKNDIISGVAKPNWKKLHKDFVDFIEGKNKPKNAVTAEKAAVTTKSEPSNELKDIDYKDINLDNTSKTRLGKIIKESQGDYSIQKVGENEYQAHYQVDRSTTPYLPVIENKIVDITADEAKLLQRMQEDVNSMELVEDKVSEQPKNAITAEKTAATSQKSDTQKMVDIIKDKKPGEYQINDADLVRMSFDSVNGWILGEGDKSFATFQIYKEGDGERLHIDFQEKSADEVRKLNEVLDGLDIGYNVEIDGDNMNLVYKNTGGKTPFDNKYTSGLQVNKKLKDSHIIPERTPEQQAEYDRKMEENRAENQRIREKLEKEAQERKEIQEREKAAEMERRKNAVDFVESQYDARIAQTKALQELTKLNKDVDRNSKIAYYEGFPENYDNMEIWELLDILGDLDKGEIREVREHGDTYSYWFELNRRQNEKGLWTNDYRTHLSKYEKNYLDYRMGQKRVEADLAAEAKDMKEHPENYASEEQLKSLFKEGGTTVKTQGENRVVVTKDNIDELLDGSGIDRTRNANIINNIKSFDDIKDLLNPTKAGAVSDWEYEGELNGVKTRVWNYGDTIFIKYGEGQGPAQARIDMADSDHIDQLKELLSEINNDGEILESNRNNPFNTKTTTEITGEKNIVTAKTVAKSENVNIIGKNNSLTTKNSANDRNNKGDSGKANEGQTALSNTVSDLQTNDRGAERPADKGLRNGGESSLMSSDNNISEHGTGPKVGGSTSGVGQSKSIRTKGDNVITEKTTTQARDINRDCVSILEKHEFSDNPADYTAEEIETLRQYEGRGGINDKADSSTQGALNQYYTKDNIIKAMWRLLDGYEHTDILEPSMGVGRFFMYAPEGSNLAGFEYDKIPGTIAKILYPNADIKIGDFQDNFMLGKFSMGDNYTGKKYDIVIGNPPYEERQGRQKALGEEPKITRFDDYFIKRGVDMLKPGGHLAFVTSSQFLRGADNYAKQMISKNAELIDAYRIPVGAFDRTGVETDIIVLRKKEGGGDSSLLSASKRFDEHPEKVLGEERDDVQGRFGPKKAVVGDLSAIDEIGKARVGSTDGLPATLKTEFTPQNKVKTEQKPVTAKTIEAKEEKKTRVQPKKEFKPNEWKDWTEVKTNKDGTQETVTWGKSLNGVVFKGKGGPTGRMTVGKGGIDKYQNLLNANGKIGDPDIKLEDDREGLNYIAGELEPNLLYASGQIPLKLEQLEKDYEGGFIDEQQYNKQKDLLEQATPQEIDYQNIYFSPYLDWVMEFPTNEINTIRKNGEMVDVKSSVRSLFKKYVGQKIDSYPNIVYKNSKGEDQVANAGRVMLDIIAKGKDYPASAKERVITLLPKEFNKFLKGDTLDAETKTNLQKEYNKKYNSYANFDYGELGYTVEDIAENFNGSPFQASDVQARGISRILTTESMIIAHGVGQGKTIEGIIGAIASMQQGKARKALVVVPAGTKASRMQTTAELFPNQEMVDLGSLAKGTGIRNKLVEMYGPDPRDWIQDGQLVFLEHSAIGRQISFKNDTLTELEQNLTDVMESHFEVEKNIEDRKKSLERADKDIERAREKGASASDIEKKQKKREELVGEIQKMGRITENSLQDIMNTYRDKGLPEEGIGKALEFMEGDYDEFLNNMNEYLDNEINVGQAKIDKEKALKVANDIFNNERPIYLEDLGIDHLTVDEAHNFRNLFNKAISDDEDGGSYHAGMQTKEGSKQAKNLYAMSQYIMSKNGGGNVILLTATPFINDPSEMYNMLSYVGKNGMMEMGVTSMDDFYDNFVGLENRLSPTASTSGVGYKNVMVGFNNTETLVKNLLDRYIDYEGESGRVVKPRLITNVSRLKMGEEQTEVENLLEEQIDKNEFKDEWRGVPLGKKRNLNDKGEAKGAVLEGMQQANLNLISPYLTKYLKDKLPSITWQEMIESSPKLKAVIEIIKKQRDMGIMRGTFIYMEQGKELHERLKQAIEESIPGVKVGIINGDKKYSDLSAKEAEKLGIEPEGAKARQTAKKFSDGEIDVLIGGANTKEGINLQGNGYHLIEVSQPRNMNDRTQLNGRMWRQGNLSNEVLDTLLLMENSSDIYRFELMSRKQERWNILEQLSAYKKGQNIEDVKVQGDLDMNEEKLALFTDPEKKARVSITMEKADLEEQKAQTKGQISTMEKLIDLMSSWKNDYGWYRKLGEGTTRMDKLYDENQKAVTTDILDENALEPLQQQLDYAWNEAMKKMEEYNSRRPENGRWTKAEMEKNVRNNSPYSYEAMKWKEIKDKMQQARSERNLVIRQTDSLGIKTVEGLSDFIQELEQQLKGIESKLSGVESTFKEKVEMFKHQQELNKENEMDLDTILKDLEEDFKHQLTLGSKEELRNWIELTKDLPKREQARSKNAVTGGKNKYSWNPKDYVGKQATFDKPKNLITSKYSAYSESNPKPEIKYVGYTPKEIVKKKDGGQLTRIGYQQQFYTMNSTLNKIKRKYEKKEEEKSPWNREEISDILARDTYYQGLKTRLTNMLVKFAKRYDDEIIKAYKKDNPGKTPTGPEDFYDYINDYTVAGDTVLKIEDEYVKKGAEYLFKKYNEGKNNVLGNDKNKVTTQAARSSI